MQSIQHYKIRTVCTQTAQTVKIMKEYQTSFIQEMNDRFSTDILDMFYLLFKYSIQAIIHTFNRHTSINHYSSVRLSMITLQISI